MTWLYIFIFIFSCFVLVRSGVWIVKSLIRIAQFLKWRKFIVSSVLMAFSTSFPEIFVAFTSALRQKPQLSFGMVIGSNILALTVVIGVGTLLSKTGLRFKGKILQRASGYAAVYGFLPLLLMSDGQVSRADGFMLLLALVFYFDQLLSEEERFSKVFSNHFGQKWAHFKLFFKNVLLFFLGMLVLLLSADGIVFSVSKLAESFNLSLVVVGALLVAIGTSLPELSFGMRSIAMGHENMILGDVMGSVVINSTVAMGLAALISPFEVLDFSPYLRGYFFTITTCLLFFVFATSDRKITKKEALFLLGIYLFFFLSELPLP